MNASAADRSIKMLTRMLKVKIQLVLFSNTITIVYEKGLHCQREISLKDGCFLKLNLNKGVKAACLKRGDKRIWRRDDVFLRNCTDSASRRRSNTSGNAPVEGGRGTASCKCATAMLERTARLAEAGRDAPSLPVGATPNSLAWRRGVCFYRSLYGVD